MTVTAISRRRGFSRKPPSYHIERLEKAPVGYIYGVITEGFGIMHDYSSQIPPRDRWRIVAYIRALQLSQHATVADAQGHPIPSPAPEFLEPGTGATLPRVKPATAGPRSPNEHRRTWPTWTSRRLRSSRLIGRRSLRHWRGGSIVA